MAFDHIYRAKFEAQTMDEIEVNFYRKSNLATTPLEVANQLVKVIEETPDSEFTIPPPPVVPTIAYLNYKEEGRWKMDFTFGGVSEGAIYKIKFTHPVYNDPDYTVDISYTATALDTNASVAEAMQDLIVANTNDAPIVLHLVSNTLTVENDQEIGGGQPSSYNFTNVSTSAIPVQAVTRPRAYPYIAIPFTSQWKNNTFVLIVHENYTPTVSANDNGVGNSPSISIVYQFSQGDYKWYYILIGEDIEPLNSYTVEVQGAEMTLTLAEASELMELRLAGEPLTKAPGDSSLFTTIIPKEATFQLLLRPQDPLDYSTFLTDDYDEWKIEVLLNGDINFTGFLIPEEGSASFKDKPYVVSLKAIDNLGLLKQIPFRNLAGNKFDTCGDPLYTIIELIAAALKPTNLDLNIQTWCTIYNSGMQNRYDDITRDMFDQIKVSIKTFLKDETEFVSCYEVLETLLKGFTISQSQNKWIIHRVDEFRNTDRYWSEYDATGTLIGGNQSLDTPCRVGRDRALRPVNIPNRLTSLTSKSVKTIFPHETIELVPNKSLTDIDNVLFVITDGNRPGQEPAVAYELKCWGQFYKSIHLEEEINNEQFYIRVNRDSNEFESDRFIVVPCDVAAVDDTEPIATNRGNWIRNLNNDFRVFHGDKLGVTVDWKLKSQLTDPDQLHMLAVCLLKVGGTWSNPLDWYSLQADGTWVNNPWAICGNAVGNDENSQDTVNNHEWTSGLGVSDSIVPYDGTVYIMLSSSSQSGAFGGDANNEVHFKNLTINYERQALYNSASRAKSDYWVTTINNNVKDEVEDEIKISDVSIPSVKGALYNVDGTLSQTQWYRLADYNTKYHYKELVNLALWQQSFRRMERVEGQFKGMTYAPSNDPNAGVPLAFHQLFILEDFDENKRFALVPPLTFNLKTGIVDAVFIEVDLSPENKGDEHKNRYNF